MKKTIILGTVIAVGVLSLTGSLLFITLKISRLEKTIVARDAVLRTQLDADAQTLDRLKQGVLLLGQDTNLFRNYLQLPPRTLPSFGDREEEEAPPPTKELYFSAVQTLLAQRKKEEAMVAFADFLNSDEVTASLSRHTLTVRNHRELEAELWKGGERLYHRLSAAAGQNSFTALSRAGQGGTITTAAEFSDYLGENELKIASFYRRLDRLEKEMETLEGGEELKDILATKGLTLSRPIQTEGGIIRPIKNGGGEFLLAIGLEEDEAVWTLQGEKYQNKAELLSAAIAAIENLDLRSPEDILIQKVREEIETLRQDDGFLAYLKTEELSLAAQPREDLYYYYYDLLDAGGESSGSFAVQKNSGELYLMDKDDVSVTSLKTLGIQREFTEKKNGPSLLK